MRGFYNYDTRGASYAEQIVNLERMVNERDEEIEGLRQDLAATRAFALVAVQTVGKLQAERDAWRERALAGEKK